MKFTNTKNLPAFLHRALSKDEYQRRKEYSVTEILKSDRAIILERRHYDEIEVDVSDSMWRMLGTSVAKMLEKGEGANDLQEERLFEKTLELTGAIDYYDSAEKTLYDVKVTSIWKFKKKEYDDYIRQLEIYAWLLNKTLGFDVYKIANILILRDATAREIDCPIQVVEHEMTGYIEQIPVSVWCAYRISHLHNIENMPDDELPFCSSVYRWAKPSWWGVYWNESKSEQPRAVAICNTEAEAKKEAEIMAAKGKTYRIEYHEGEQFKRCEYCNAKPFCNQFKEKKI